MKSEILGTQMPVVILLRPIFLLILGLRKSEYLVSEEILVDFIFIYDIIKIKYEVIESVKFSLL